MPYRFDKHRCDLKLPVHPGLLPLPPNASSFQRFLHNLRKTTIMDTNNKKCKAFFRTKATRRAELNECVKIQRNFIVHPFSKANVCREIMFFLIWSWNYFYIPIYRIVPYKANEIVTWIFWLLQCFIIFTFFIVGYVNKERNEIIITPRKIMVRYLKTYFFFDLMAVAYMDVFDLFFDFSDVTKRFWWYTFVERLAVALSYIVRIKSVLDILKQFMREWNFSRKTSFVIYHSYTLLLVLNTITGLVYIFPMLMNFGQVHPDSWIHQAKINIDPTANPWGLYSQCLLLAVCYFFGATHGFYTISLPSEDFLIAFITICGRMYTFFLIADLLKLFGIITLSESKYEQVLTQIKNYMDSTNMPAQLRSRFLKFYEYKSQKRYFNEIEIASTLTEQLKTEIFLFGAKRLIERVPVLGALPSAVLAGFFAEMKSETFLANDFVSKIGDPVNNIYFVSSGTVAVSNEDGLELSHLVDGDEFGFISLWTAPTVVQKYNYMAVECTDIYYIDKRFLKFFFGNHSKVMEYFERRVKKRCDKYAEMEENYRKGGVDFLTALKRKLVLERSVRRPFNLD